MTRVVQFPTMANPLALNTVDELRTALDAANVEIMGLALRNSMLETAVSHLGNDIADIAQACGADDMNLLLHVAQRICERVSIAKALAQETQNAQTKAERVH